MDQVLTNPSQAILHIKALEAAQVQSRHQYEAEQAATAAAITKAQDELTLLEVGVTPQEIALAESVIYVKGNVGADVKGIYDAAIAAIADGGNSLIEKRCIVKLFRASRHREDLRYNNSRHEHGDTVLEVGLTAAVRDRVKEGPLGNVLSDAESQAAVRYLLAKRTPLDVAQAVENAAADCQRHARTITQEEIEPAKLTGFWKLLGKVFG